MVLRRLYLDTNVFVEGFEEPGSASDKVVALAAAGQFFVVESEYLMREIAEVFGRVYGRKVAAVELDVLSRLPAHDVVSFDESTAALSGVREHTRDFADAPHFAAARAGRAELLVTRNRRSVKASMFSVLPIATPEDILPALEGASTWPSAETLRVRWERWAKGSSRSPRKEE